MEMSICPSHVDFVHAGRVVGRYNYRDAFKPHFHPLRTPRGHVVTLASPHDHVHHKGLMYALRTPAVNFWEERPTRDGEAVGAQRHREFADVVASGEVVGFAEVLHWISTADDSLVFVETREIRCRFMPQESGYLWTWNTSLAPHGRTTLVQSQWSRALPDGRTINYHGLGIRMRREFGGETRGCELWLDGRRCSSADFAEAMGCTPAEATYIGRIDGTWPVERGQITMMQDQREGLFVMNTPFAFLSLGPSNLSAVELGREDRVAGRYRVLIADAPA